MPAPQPQIADVVTEPELIRKVKPAYPQAAVAADLQGNVILEGVIGVDGKVRDITVVRSAHRITRRSGAKGLGRVSIQASSSQRDTRTASVRQTFRFN